MPVNYVTIPQPGSANYASGSDVLHSNRARAACLAGIEISMLDSPVIIPANGLSAGRVIEIGAFGSFLDPGVNAPTVTVRLNLGSNPVAVQSFTIAGANWHMLAKMTVRSVGVNGQIAGTIWLITDNSGMGLVGMDTQIGTVNTGIALELGVTGLIQSFTGNERIFIEQLTVSFI